MAGARIFTICWFSLCLTLVSTDYGHHTSQGSLGQPWRAYQLSGTFVGSAVGRFVPPEIAAIYCANCRQRRWTICINLYCHGRSFGPRLPLGVIAPTSGYGVLGFATTAGRGIAGFNPFRNSIAPSMGIRAAPFYYKKTK